MNFVSRTILFDNDITLISNYSLVIFTVTNNIIKTFDSYEHQYKTHLLGHLDFTTNYGAKNHRMIWPLLIDISELPKGSLIM